MSEQKKMIKIAILGTGFGAMHAALRLAKLRKKLPKHIAVHVDLISRTDYFWLVTMAHEIATGNLLPDDVVQPVRSLPVSVYDDFVQAEVVSIDTDHNTVTFNLLGTVDPELETDQTRQYDYIISGLGSEVFHFNVPGTPEHVMSLKTLDDVRVIKNRILQSFEDAEMLSDVTEITALLSFVVVGGGATGVEIAGEMADLINVPLANRFPKVAKYASITIIHGGDRVGVPGHGWMSDGLEEILQNKHCVRLLCNSFVTKVTPEGVFVGDDFYPSRNVIWTGGVTASKVELTAAGSIDRTKQGRIVVTDDLSLESAEKIFVIGDQASVTNQDGAEYPMRAQFAVRQGEQAAENIYYDLVGINRESFVYQDKGVILGLGNGSALASVYGRRIKGRLAYWMYKLIYIPQIIGWRARFKTVTSWIMNMFTPRDLSKL